MSHYELAILGHATPDERSRLTRTIEGMVDVFGLAVGTDVVIRDAHTISVRDVKAATAAAYFGGSPQADVAVTRELVRASLPVIPTVPAGTNFAAAVPSVLQGFNGLFRRADGEDMTELAAALLECVGLLRRQRRVFISYRRIESRAVAVQLYDLLSERGFDVFLDTHDIRPGEPFQDVLWHRLCDSDVMVMLDTPTYFESKWTRQEIGRARAKGIHVLRVVWPEHVPNRSTDFAETINLDPGEFTTTDGPLVSATADQIVLAVEGLRSRSIASRHMTITGKLRAEVAQIGATVLGVGAHHAITIRLEDGRMVWAYPVVGIPTAETLNDVVEKTKRADRREAPVLVYDHVGIRDTWSAHLRWLDENISSVRAIKVVEAGWQLAAWEG